MKYKMYVDICVEILTTTSLKTCPQMVVTYYSPLFPCNKIEGRFSISISSIFNCNPRSTELSYPKTNGSPLALAPWNRYFQSTPEVTFISLKRANNLSNLHWCRVESSCDFNLYKVLLERLLRDPPGGYLIPISREKSVISRSRSRNFLHVIPSSILFSTESLL